MGKTDHTENKNLRQRIFVCDDNVKLRSSIESILGYTYDVSGASNGQELLDCLAQDSNFNLILLDNNMPGMPGIEVLPKLREKYPHIKVVMFSGDRGIKGDCLSAGSSAFIEKSESIQEVSRIISDVLSGGMKKKEIKNTITLSDQFSEINNALCNIMLLADDGKDRIELNDDNTMERHLEQYSHIKKECERTAKAVEYIQAYLRFKEIPRHKYVPIEDLHKVIEQNKNSIEIVQESDKGPA